MISNTQVVNAFTVDVEDYFQVSAFESLVERDRWHKFESRVVANTHRLLDLLDEHAVKATFFVLGWVAEGNPQLVRDIHTRGHEVGSHGYWHRLIYRQTPTEFREDVSRTRKVLESIISAPVVSYRAPTFSITRESWWALEILVQEGFKYDSSIFPVRHDRYGVPDAPQDIHTIDTDSGPILEFPPAFASILGARLPVSGGGYFRLYPYLMTHTCLTRINRSRPFVFYIHPWEVDALQPRMQGVSAATRFRHYVNLSRTETKLGHLLGKFRFDTMRSVIDHACPPIHSSGKRGIERVC